MRFNISELEMREKSRLNENKRLDENIGIRPGMTIYQSLLDGYGSWCMELKVIGIVGPNKFKVKTVRWVFNDVSDNEDIDDEGINSSGGGTSQLGKTEIATINSSNWYPESTEGAADFGEEFFSLEIPEN